jgi:RNA polymerase sigma-70 factor (ECF subfamily)
MGFPPLTAAEQEWLVGRIRSGDEQAEARIVDLFSRPVRMMVRVRAGRRLEEDDVVQEVFVAALTSLRRGQLRDADRLGAFVAGIARNVINNRLRNTRRAAVEPLAGNAGAAVADLREEIARRERRASVRRALDDLAPEDRRILVLTVIEGLRSSQIAQRLGLTEEAVRARKSRALKRLKARLDT